MSINIGLDLDNTLVDFTEGFRRHVSNVSMLTAERALEVMPDPSAYDFAGWQWGSTAFSGLGEAFAHAEASKGFYALLEPFEGAVEALGALVADGAMLTVVTARASAFHEQTMECLHEHGVDFDEIIFSKTKVEHHRSHGGSVDIFFDDSPTVLTRFHENMVPAVAFHTGYNGSVPSTHRVKEWSEVKGLGLM